LVFMASRLVGFPAAKLAYIIAVFTSMAAVTTSPLPPGAPVNPAAS
jgi:hypothetical protein